MLRYLIKTLIVVMSIYANSVMAVNCQRAATPVENTICNSDQLHWLDSTMTVIYRNMLVKNDAQEVQEKYRSWEKSLNECTSDGCIERAYYKGIGMLSEPDPNFDWQGKWWNESAANMSGGTIQFSRSAEWSVISDMKIWAGLNHDDFAAEARKIYGMATIDNVTDTSNCRVLMIPLSHNEMQVYSNADWGCRLSMPDGAFIDGYYRRANSDPRPQKTLLTMNIMPNKEVDDRFRALVGGDYQQFVNTSNTYIYQDDTDNIGAIVINMWVRGAANTQNAIIMYTAEDIWAACISPGTEGKVELHYFSTRGDSLKSSPRTIQNWRSRYLND